VRAADAVCRYLEAEGVSHVFGNPGTTEVPFMDALVDSPLRFVLCLQENVAVSAADGLAQATRRPQVVNLHTGPGLAQGMSGLYMAAKHRSPLVVTVGNEDTRFALTEPLLRGEVVEMARPLAKWAYETNSVDDVIPSLRRAFKVARTPPCGPVVLSWPMDVLAREVSDELDLRPADLPSSPAPDPEAVERVASLLASAVNPAFVAGDDVGRTRCEELLMDVATRVGAKVFGAPLALFQNVPNTHPLHAGPLPPFPSIARAFLNGHDVVVVVGAKAFLLYYFQPVDPVPPDATLVHVHPDPWELAKNYPTEVAVTATADRFLQALSGLVTTTAAAKERTAAAAASDARAATETWARAEAERVPLSAPGVVAMAHEVLGDVRVVDESVTASLHVRSAARLPDSDSYFGHKGGALGWGASAAVGVALADPRRRVLCTLGDGSLMYVPQALYTAARTRARITYVVFNNRGYAIIKSGTRAAKGRAYETDTYIGMDIDDPPVDMLSLARGLGAGAASATTPDELRHALEASAAHEGPFLIDCATDRAIPDLPF